MLVNITGPENMTMHELNAASKIIYEEAGEEANVILGCILDNQINDEIQVTVIATGLNKAPNNINTIDSNRYSDDDSIVAPRFKPQNLTHSDNRKYDAINNDQITNDESRVENKNDEERTNNSFNEDLDIPTFMRNRNIS